MKQRLRKFTARVLPALAAASLAVSFQPWRSGFSQPACAAEGNHAGMVIRFSADAQSQRSWCLAFSQESISGIEALRLTGLPVVTKTFGSQGEYVCKIGEVGTETADCPAKDGSYWGYWRMTSDGWRHSGIGASGARVRCGTLEGWSWLQGGSGPAPEPAEFSSICTSAACKAVSSSISAPPSSRDEPEQTSAAAPPGSDAGLAADESPDEPSEISAAREATGRPAVAQADSAAEGSDEREPASGSRQPSDGEPPIRRDVTQTVTDGAGASGSAAAPAARSRAASGRSSWALYGGLGAAILLLAAVRAYLFWRPPGRKNADP